MRGDYPTLMWGTFFKGSIGLLLVLFICILWVSGAKAVAPPTTMSFQGRLTNTAGNIVADGEYNMVFAIYSVSSGGSSLWTETRETTNRVTVTNGLFSVRLGEVTPLTASIFSSNSSLYFGIQIATPATATCATAACATFETEMTPRSQLATSAYSFNATNAEDATNLGGVAATNYARKDAANTFTQANTFNNTATFNGGATIDTFSGGTWLNLPTTGPSAIGTGGAGSNAWIGYAAGPGNYFTDAATGDLAYRNTAGRILLGNSGGHSQVAISSNNITFNPLADTVNAFQIQNAANEPFFTVDTSAGSKSLQVGSTTPDANDIQFVLDSAISDPVGINGGSYYNTDLQTNRCYIAGVWQACSPHIAKVTADVSTTSTAFQDVTGLNFYIVSNTDYSLRCNFLYRTAAITTGVRVGLSGPGTPNDVSGMFSSMTTTTASISRYFSGYNSGTATTGVPVANATTPGEFSAVIENGATSGTLQVRFNSEVGASNTTIQKGSSCQLFSL